MRTTTSPRDSRMATFSPADWIRRGLSITRMRPSSAARRARISLVPSVLPPSATSTSRRSRGYVWAWTLRRQSSMKPASLRHGIATVTNSRATARY